MNVQVQLISIPNKKKWKPLPPPPQQVEGGGGGGGEGHINNFD